MKANRGSFGWSWEIGILVLLAGVIALQRLHTYHEPVDWDVGCYAVFGHEMNLGKSLYKDIWDIKPPGIFVTYALAERVAGYGMGQVFLLAVTAGIVTMLGVWRAGGLVAAACFAIVGGAMSLDANRPNTEMFINACLAWTIALLATSWDGKWRGWLKAIGIGALFGLATLYKQVAIAPAGLLVLAHVISPPNSVKRSSSLGDAMVMIAAIALIWLGVAGDFYLTGRGELFWPTIVSQPRFYGGSTTQALLASLRPGKLVPRILVPLLPCAVLMLCMLFAGARYRRRWTILLAAMLGAQLAIALPDRFLAHYYQFWLVPLTIGAGWGAAALLETQSLRVRWLAPAGIVTVLVLLVIQQAPDDLLPARKWSEINDGPYHAWIEPVGRELDRILPPGQTFYDFADQGWLYFVAKRRPPAVGFGRSQLVAGPISRWLTDRTLKQLKRDPPPLVTTWAFNDDEHIDHPVARWIVQNYRPVNDGVNRWPLVLWRRVESSGER